MLLKLFMKLFLRNSDSYTNITILNKKIYIISIEEYRPFKNELKKFKSVLESAEA